jgi:hypothetical protein
MNALAILTALAVSLSTPAQDQARPEEACRVQTRASQQEIVDVYLSLSDLSL